MSSGQKILITVVLWFLQTTLVVLLVNAEWLERQGLREQASAQAYLGPVLHERVRARAMSIYRDWLVDTRVVSTSYERLLPARGVEQYGMEGLAPWFFAWLEDRLDALWWLAFHAIYRVQTLWEWLPVIGSFVAVSAIDGIASRRIKRSSNGYASADRYALSRRVLFLLLFAPLLYLFLPISIAPVAIPVWGAALAVALAMFTANLQQQI